MPVEVRLMHCEMSAGDTERRAGAVFCMKSQGLEWTHHT